MTDDYWPKQARKHRAAAQSLFAKYAATGEVRWLRQANTNIATARRIEAAINCNRS